MSRKTSPKPSVPAKRRLPRAPLPRQRGGVHEDKTRRPWRERKHKGRDDEE